MRKLGGKLQEKLHRQCGATMLEYSLVLALIAVIAIPTVWRLGMGMKKPECEALHGLTIQAAWDEHLLMCMKEDGGMGFPEPWF